MPRPHPLAVASVCLALAGAAALLLALALRGPLSAAASAAALLCAAALVALDRVATALDRARAELECVRDASARVWSAKHRPHLRARGGSGSSGRP